MNETPTPQAPSKGFSIASLVTGILALLCGLAAILSVPLGIAAIILGIIGIRKHVGKGMAIAGIVTGSLGIVAGLLTSLLVFMAVPSLQRSTQDTQVKNDVTTAVAAVYDYTTNNQGILPSTIEFNGNEFQSQYLYSVATDLNYTVGTDCDGKASNRSFTIKAVLSDGTTYCQD